MRIAMALSILVAIIAFSYYIGTQRGMVDDLQDQIDTQQERDDAKDACPDGLPFLERLQCHNERTGNL